MTAIQLGGDPQVLASRHKSLVAFARAVQMASRGRVGFTLGGLRIGDLDDAQTGGIDAAGRDFLAGIVEAPLKPGNYPVESLLALREQGLDPAGALQRLYATHPAFASQDFVRRIEARQLKVFLLGSAGSGVVSATQDLVAAFVAAGYNGRAFPLFDPSKKGAPVKGYGVVSREPILNHAPFVVPDVVLLFDPSCSRCCARCCASIRRTIRATSPSSSTPSWSRRPSARWPSSTSPTTCARWTPTGWCAASACRPTTP
jgi:hypothetical protein